MTSFKKQYKLSSYCRLISGQKKSAIYDLKNQKIYSINEIGRKVLNNEIINSRYADKLIELELITSNKDQSRKIILPKITPKLKFVWLEITSACNLKCLHCYGGFGPNKVNNTVNWIEAIRQIAALKCKSIQFIGGEPLLHPHLIDYIYEAKAHNLDVEVFTNGTLLNDNWISILKKLNVKLAISFYSDNETIHEKVTQVKGSYKKTKENLEKLKKTKIKVRTAIIAMKQNQETLESTRRYLNNCGFYCRKPDIVRPTGRGVDKEITPSTDIFDKYALIKKPSFNTSYKSYALAQKYNNCWFGKMAITSNGDVIPCIFARNHIAGNINQNKLVDILKNLIKEYWTLNLDKVKKCQNCEYRYTCHNCRPLSESTYGDLLEENPRCLYNPKTGIWGE